MLHHVVIMFLAKLGESSHTSSSLFRASLVSFPLQSRPNGFVNRLHSPSPLTQPQFELPPTQPTTHYPNPANPLFELSSSTVRLVKHAVPPGLDPLQYQKDLVPRSGTRSSPGYPYTPTHIWGSSHLQVPLASK